MRIIPDSSIKLNRDVAKRQNQGKETNVTDSASKSAAHDKITISSTQSPVLSDADLLAQLKKSILGDIQSGASEHKLGGLKQQIALDEYDLNVPDIVRKMMLDSNEVS